MDEILMDGKIIYDTKHSFLRAKQRAGLNKKKAKRFFDLARERGIRASDCKWSADRRFLSNKTDENKEAVAFNGYCFLLSKNTGSCITIIQLPSNFGKKKNFTKRKNGANDI